MYPHLFRTPGVARFAEAIDAERQAQLAKFGDQHHPDGTGLPVYQHAARRYRDQTQRNADAGVLAWRDVLLEEVYEALAESDPARLRAELVQVAAGCAAWISDLDQRVYPCAHCGEEIAVDPVRWTWFGPVPEPGQPSNLAPRYHLDRDECRVAGGQPPSALRPATPDHNA
jgi:hypothetical protein